MNYRQWASKPFQIYRLLLVLLILYLTLMSAFSFIPGFDDIWYHLPNALRIFGLTDIKVSNYIETIITSFPPLADTLMGLLIYISGTVNSASLLNVLGLFSAISGLYLIERDRPRWVLFLTSILAIPLVVLHSVSSYVDLFSACGILLSFGLLLRLRTSLLARYLFVAGITTACLSKFQVWPFAGILLGIASVDLARSSIGPRQKIVFFFFAYLGFSIWPATNFIRFANPTYPYKAPIVGSFFADGSDDVSKFRRFQSPKKYSHLPQAGLFLISLFELSQFDSPDRSLKWTLDQGAEEGINDPNFRMGGFSICTMLLLTLAYLYGSIRRKISWQEHSFFLLAFGILTVLPQSHELRYFLFFPLCLSWTLTRSVDILGSKVFYKMFFILMISSLVHTLEYTKIFKKPWTNVIDVATDEQRKAWAAYSSGDRERPLCAGTSRSDLLMFAGPTLMDYPVVASDVCEGYFLPKNENF